MNPIGGNDIRIGGGRTFTSGGPVIVDVGIAGSVIGSVAPVLPDPEVDASGLIVAPGFIELQINGGYGFDLLTNPQSMWELGTRLPEQGVTSFQPTVITGTQGQRDAAIEAFSNRPPGYNGAAPVGLHFEGPMLSEAGAGAHTVDLLLPPAVELIEGWSAQNGVTMVTIAPELPGAVEIIKELSTRGVVVSMGHSEATAAEARRGFEAGASSVTHLFNAMRQPIDRTPSLAWFALSEPGLSAGLIVDGLHVDPTVIRAAWNAKGPNGIYLISDAISAMGLPHGTYQLGERTVTADESGVRNAQGGMAGSALTLDQSLRNLVGFTGCTVEDALTTVTATPARVINSSTLGRIQPQATADIVLLTEELEVVMTFCQGALAYVRDNHRNRIKTGLKES